MNDTARGSGRTSRQIRNAPAGAVFIWWSRKIGYAQRLRTFLGRDDIEVVRPAWLATSDGYRGPVLADHALALTFWEKEQILCINVTAGVRINERGEPV